MELEAFAPNEARKWYAGSAFDCAAASGARLHNPAYARRADARSLPQQQMQEGATTKTRNGTNAPLSGRDPGAAALEIKLNVNATIATGESRGIQSAGRGCECRQTRTINRQGKGTLENGQWP